MEAPKVSMRKTINVKMLKRRIWWCPWWQCCQNDKIPKSNDSVQARQVSLAKSVSQLQTLHGSAVMMKIITRPSMLMMMMLGFIFCDDGFYILLWVLSFVMMGFYGFYLSPFWWFPTLSHAATFLPPSPGLWSSSPERHLSFKTVYSCDANKKIFE